MPDLKLVVWNMEWLNDLFTAAGGTVGYRPDGESAQHDRSVTVAERRDDLIGSLNELNADLVVEGPNDPVELQFFFGTPALTGLWRVHL